MVLLYKDVSIFGVYLCRKVMSLKPYFGSMLTIDSRCVTILPLPLFFFVCLCYDDVHIIHILFCVVGLLQN